MSSISCPESNLDTWGQTLFAPLGNGRYPLDGTLELTERCDLNCVHCYINQPAGSQIIRQKEMTTNQVKLVLDKIATAGCLFLEITGGEPLLRPDFPEIYMYARQLGMIVTLLTNATMLTPELVDLLAASKPHLVDISVYGATKETYESVTRIPGSFARFINGLDLLHERHIRISLKSIILTKNKHEIPAMQHLAEKYGCELRYDGILWPRIDGDEDPYPYRLSARELVVMDLENAQRAEEWKEQADVFTGKQVRNDYVFSCGAGLRSFHIDSSGLMASCTMVRKPGYNLLEVSFEEAWEKLGDLRRMMRQQKTVCQTCTAGPLCSQCPGWSQLVHGDYETPVNYVCEIGQLRAELFSSVKIELLGEVMHE